MPEIHGVEFSQSVAPIVEQLIQRIEHKIGKAHLFSSTKHLGLKWALRLPGESKAKHKKAFRLFLAVSPDGSGAMAKRPRPPKTGWERMPLTSSTLDEVFRSAMSWFYQVQESNIPDEYQDTENRPVLADGRFESDPRKF